MNYINASYREAVREDLDFIFNSWLKGFRNRSSWASLIPSQIYFSNHKLIISKLLKEGHILVACNPDYPEQIFGYIVFQPTAQNVTICHYVYVKHTYRKLGLGTSLMGIAGHSSSHDARVPMIATHNLDLGWDHLSERWNIIFNPYVLGAEFFYDKAKSIEAS